MLDENIWLQLSDEDKFAELQSLLDTIINIDEGRHELSNTVQQGKLASIKRELHDKIFKIIELENAT